MRAAGFWAGLATALLDLLKGASTVWLARILLPGIIWVEVLAPVAAVLGHNYSLFLMERDKKGTLRLRGGAGGAPTVGGALGLWFPSFFIILPVGALILFLVGYASLATMSVALVATLIFAIRAAIGYSPWQYVIYGLFTEIILILALLPNIRRLLSGTERLVGLRARQKRSSSSN
jgi:glycerol-3-phosphate acyltransferase PlsY